MDFEPVGNAQTHGFDDCTYKKVDKRNLTNGVLGNSTNKLINNWQAECASDL
jgi:hypothetical protein